MKEEKMYIHSLDALELDKIPIKEYQSAFEQQQFVWIFKSSKGMSKYFGMNKYKIEIMRQTKCGETISNL